ncbi:MAG: type II secretion system protein GspJ [Polyangiales bacterium]
MMRRKTYRSAYRSEGMTLIEVMIAVAIMGMISAVIWGGFTQTIATRTRVTAGLDRNQEVTSAVERMARELSQAFVSTHLNPNQSLQVVQTIFDGIDHGDRDRINFTSFSHQRLYRDAHESDQNELSYFVTDHPTDSDVQILARREAVRIDDRPEQGGRIEILLNDVEEFDVEYLDHLTGQWLRTWSTVQAAGQPNRLPAQIKIRIVTNHPDTGRPMTLATRIELPIRYALNHATYIR